MVTAIQAKNDNIRKLLGVDTWHKKGYTGTRGLSISLESDQTDHGSRVKAVFHEIAPDRELVCIGLHGSVDENYFNKAIDEIIARNADTCTRSQHGARNGDAFEKVKEFCTCFNSSGNDGMEDDSHCNSIIAPYVYGVGAIQIGSDGEISPAYYNSKSEYVDFVAPASFYIFGYTQTGTSFASPCVCGMAALVNDFFIDKTGRPLSSENMYRFLKDCSRDLWTKGKDVKSGWGVPILPDPDEIDVWEYQDTEESPQIIETYFGFVYPLRYRGETKEIILHHAAADGSVEDVHKYHQKIGYPGIAYNYYIRKDGKIYRGRPEGAVGGHTSSHNDKSIGICFEGNFEEEQMLDAQKKAGISLVKDILSRYHDLSVLRHKDVDSTLCPGKNFPYEEMNLNMTGEKIHTELAKYLLTKNESEWSEKEGHWKKAKEAGVVDGTNPQGYITREQVVAILGRLGLI